jgi:hypothetical protein
VTLTWEHGKRDVDIYRNGLIYNSRRNRFTYTDNFRIVGSGTMTYKICNQGTTECSNEVSVPFASRRAVGIAGTPNAGIRTTAISAGRQSIGGVTTLHGRANNRSPMR